MILYQETSLVAKDATMALGDGTMPWRIDQVEVSMPCVPCLLMSLMGED